jgi:hypothetical protein
MVEDTRPLRDMEGKANAVWAAYDSWHSGCGAEYGALKEEYEAG